MKENTVQKDYNAYNGKAEYYDKYRLPYSEEIIQKIIQVTGLDHHSIIADIGSGTGKLTEPFLEIVKRIYAVEPNREMRRQAELHYSQQKSFRSINGLADKTQLENHCIDIILCGQAIHWFPPDSTLLEFHRILKQNGWIICVWNTFGQEKYPQIHDFLEDERLMTYSFPMNAEETFQEYLGGSISAAYNPNPGDSHFEEFTGHLKQTFDKDAKNGVICIYYETTLVIGKLKNIHSTRQ